MAKMKKFNLRDKIADIPDFPEKGVVFRDITPLLLDAEYFDETIKQMVEKVRHLKVEVVLGVDSRGFLFGPVIARELGVGFVPVRKANKLLPRETVQQTYTLEYGTDGVKIHTDSVLPGQKALIVDDLVATGGTALATAKLVKKLGGQVAAFLFLNELCFLKPRQVLKGYRVISLIKYRK